MSLLREFCTWNSAWWDFFCSLRCAAERSAKCQIASGRDARLIRNGQCATRPGTARLSIGSSCCDSDLREGMTAYHRYRRASQRSPLNRIWEDRRIDCSGHCHAHARIFPVHSLRQVHLSIVSLICSEYLSLGVPRTSFATQAVQFQNTRFPALNVPQTASLHGSAGNNNDSTHIRNANNNSGGQL
jgi:hypothetical protein